MNAYYMHLRSEELAVDVVGNHLMVVNTTHMRSKKGLMTQLRLGFLQYFPHSPILYWSNFESDPKNFGRGDDRL